MDNFLGEFFYIIMSILILVFTALGNKKKRDKYKQQTGKELDDFEEADRKPFSLEEIFGNIKKEEEPVADYERDISIPDKQKSDPEPQYSTLKSERVDLFEEKRRLTGMDSSRDAERFKRAESDDDPDSITSSEIKGVEKEYEHIYNTERISEKVIDHELFGKFDVRKAIIYSEVINPKYF